MMVRGAAPAWSGDKVQRPIEAALAVHVLAVLALQDDVHFAHIVAVHLLVFGGVEAAEAHRLHHLLLVGTFTRKVSFGDDGTRSGSSSGGSRSGRRGRLRAAGRRRTAALE